MKTLIRNEDATLTQSALLTRSTTRGPNHNGMVDAVRVIASLLIIWIHVPRSESMIATTVIGRFAVPFFLFAAVYFAAQNGLQKRERTIAQTITSRLRRIYVPFALWSVVYFGLKCVKLVLDPAQPNAFPGWEVLFVGTAYHLWFLPFVFATTVAAFAGTKKTPARHARSTMFVVVGIGFLCCFVSPDAWRVDNGLKYAWHTLPAALWAFAFALFVHRTNIHHIRQAAGPVAFAVAGACMLLLIVHGRNVLWENLAGMSLFVWAYWKTTSRPMTPAIMWLAPLSFGIYLSHMLFIKTAESLAQRLGLGVSPQLDIAIFLGSAVGSIALCWAYQTVRTRFANSRISWMLP